MKFNVTLSRPFDLHIEQVLHNHGISVVFYDEYLPDYVIARSDTGQALNSLDFVRDFYPVRKGELLRGSKKFRDASTPDRVEPTPAIDVSILDTRGLYGMGAKVAVIDSGCGADLRRQLEGYIDFSNPTTSEEQQGHASLVITLVRHYARGARIYLAQVCNQTDDVDEESVVRALKWARSIDGLKIINMSLGFKEQCAGICNLARIVNKMATDGYIITVAAGNDPDQTCSCPGCAEGAITVGALSKDGQDVAHFSSRGHVNSNKPDLIVPAHGQGVYRAGLFPYQGTSFAAPVVAGVAAATQLLLADTTRFKTYLLESCVSLQNVPVNAQGFGRIDISRLLEVVAHGEEVSALDK